MITLKRAERGEGKAKWNLVRKTYPFPRANTGLELLHLEYSVALLHSLSEIKVWYIVMLA